MINTDKVQNLIYKFGVTIGMLPTSFKNSLTYEEQLFAIDDYINKVVVPALNTNVEALQELQNLFLELQDYVNNYFDNLDVQEEINNKIDELVENGTITTLIEEYINPYIIEQNQKINQLEEKIDRTVSGAPLVASSTSDMTDTTRVYVNTTDGKWYYYNGTAWVAGGTYQATEDSETLTLLDKDKNVIYGSLKYNQLEFEEYFIYHKGQYASNGGINTSTTNRLYVTPIVDKNFAKKIITKTGYDMNILKFRNGSFVNSTGWINEFDLTTLDNDMIAKINVQKSDSSDFDDITGLIPLTFIMETYININKNNIENLNNKINYLNALTEVEWENGRINMQSDDVEYPSNLKTVDFIPNNIITANSINNYKFNVWAYDKTSEEKIGIWNGSSFVHVGGIWVSSFNFANFNQYKFKLVLKNDDFDILYPENSKNILLSVEDNIKTNIIDLLIFMGQSNMAGRGSTTQEHPETAPEIISGAGYEYRAISDPTQLYPITEPFGLNENNPNGIDDRNNIDGAKTGSLVTAFANSYYKNGLTPIIAVSASKGATSITEWLPNSDLLNDAIQRFNDAVIFCNEHGYTIRHKYVVWCQGETDAKNGMNKQTYNNNLLSIIQELQTECLIEKLLLIRIGNRNEQGHENMYNNIIEAQTELAQTNKDVIMISTDFASMRERGLMKDQSHYYQEGYNECGDYAGVNASIFANTGKETTMYDSQYNNLYYSHKN